MTYDPHHPSPRKAVGCRNKGSREPGASSRHLAERENRLPGESWHRSAESEEEERAAEKQVSSITVQIHAIAYDKLRRTVGSFPHEHGGIFVSRVGPLYIEDFIFDDISDRAVPVYYPHADYLNGIVDRQYEPLGFFFVGLAHSHPPGMWHPSGHAGWGDVKAARNNLKSNENLDSLFIPIVESEATSGTFRLHPYVILRDGFRICRADVEIIRGSQPSGDKNAKPSRRKGADDESE